MTSPYPHFPFLVWAVSMCMMVVDVVADGHNPMSRPAAGEIVPVGEPYVIRWRPGTLGPVFIALLGDSEYGTGNLTTSTPNNGTFTWTPLPILAEYNGGTGYFLQICARDSDDCTYTYDGRFSFSQSPLSTTTTSTLPTLVTSTATSVASSVTLSTSVSTDTPSVASTDASADCSRGMSCKAKIAIGVVLSNAGTTVLLIGGYFMLRKHKHSKASSNYDKAELPGYSGTVKKTGVGEHYREELPGLSGTGPAPVHELETERSRPS